MRTEKSPPSNGELCNRLGGTRDKNWVHPNLRAVFLYAASGQQSSEVAESRLPTFGAVPQPTFTNRKVTAAGNNRVTNECHACHSRLEFLRFRERGEIQIC